MTRRGGGAQTKPNDSMTMNEDVTRNGMTMMTKKEEYTEESKI